MLESNTGICKSCGVEEELGEGLCSSCWDKAETEENPAGRGISVGGGKEATNAYRNTPAGKEYVTNYNHSEPARDARRKYEASGKGKAARQIYLQRKRLKLLRALQFADLEAQGLCGLCGEAGHKAEIHVRQSENGASPS